MSNSRPRITEKRKGGYLSEVNNPQGTKRAVYIFQGKKPGFTAAYSGSHKDLPGSSSNGEALARKLAKSGHKKVTFKD